MIQKSGFESNWLGMRRRAVDWKATNKMNCVSLELAHGPSDKPLMTRVTVWRDLSARLRSKLKKDKMEGGGSIAIQPADECTRRVSEDLQDGKFARLEREDREKEETEHEADGSAEITSSKDEHPIPSAYYSDFG